MAIKKIKDTEGTIHDIDAIKFGGLDPDAFVLAAGDTMTGKLSIESNSWNNQLSLKRSNNGENWGPAIEFATEGGTSAYVCVPPAKRRLASTPDGTTPTLKYYHQVGDIKNGEGINVTTSDCSATISLKSPTSTTKGGVKNGSTVTSATGYTACPIINDVVYYKDTDTDTNNDQKTSSSNKTDTKLLLVGATTASTAGQTTYTNSNCYVGTDNCLYSNGSKVLTAGDGDTKNTVGITTTTSKIYLVGATSTSTTTGASANSYTNASVFVSGNYLYSGGAKVLTAGDGDTKNTVGITTTASKIYLVGATSTSTTTGASAISYTNASVFISGNYLYSGGVQVKTADVNVTSTITSTSTYYLCGSTSSSNATGSLVKRSNVYVNASAYLNAVAFYETSDERLKDFSNKIDVDLDKISKIKKHRFTWKDSENKKEEIGVSAQEIRELYPEIVSENEEGYLSVAYDKLAVVALAAIDELHKKNKELEARIELLESKLLN